MARRITMSIAEIVERDPQLAEDLRDAGDVVECAAIVRIMRERAGLTQGQLGAAIGVSQQRVSKLEKGDGAEGLTYVVLKKVARVCGFDWNQRDFVSFLVGQGAVEDMGRGSFVGEALLGHRG